MIRTGEEYRESIRDGRQVWIDGEKVNDVTTHPAFKPIVDIRSRIYDLGHDEATADVMTYTDEATGEVCAIGSKPPATKQDWHAKRAAVEQCDGACKAVPVMRACAALAIDAGKSCGAHGYATARKLGAAQNTALKECYGHGGKDCMIRAWICDSKG